MSADGADGGRLQPVHRLLAHGGGRAAGRRLALAAVRAAGACPTHNSVIHGWNAYFGQVDNQWLLCAVLWGMWNTSLPPGCKPLLILMRSQAVKMSFSQEPKMLEELTGLAAMHAAAELADFDMEVPDSEDGDEWTTL
jgi:hypothetical protein